MKKKVLLFILIIGIFSIYGCTKKEEVVEDSLKFKNEYEEYNGEKTSSGKDYINVSISEDNIIKYSSIDEVIELINNKGTGVIYFGYPTCPWCRNMVEPLLASADSTNLDKIYYVNMYNERDTIEYKDGQFITTKEAGENYYTLVNLLDSILDSYIVTDEEDIEHDTGNKRIYVPLVVFIKEGKVVAYHSDTVESQTNPYIKLDDSQYEELYNIYKDGISKVLEDTCDSKC